MKYLPKWNSPTCVGLPPLSKGPEDLAEWLADQMPRDSESIGQCYMRLGMALAAVLGASLDFLCELDKARKGLANG